MGDSPTICELRRRTQALLAEQDFEALGAISRQIELESAAFSAADQQALRHLVSDLITQVAVIRAETVLEIKRLQGGADARQVYASVSGAT